MLRLPRYAGTCVCPIPEACCTSFFDWVGDLVTIHPSPLNAREDRTDRPVKMDQTVFAVGAVGQEVVQGARVSCCHAIGWGGEHPQKDAADDGALDRPP
mmetsp:Transcript_1654/g.3226  ORF Transcript_1654/g.3226 Transcript_1654/m.3226 type:complete len:99 (+) Transcript_1654:52-348(+)